MPNLCSSTKCTGCSACASVCSKNAIKMEADNHGFLHPVVNDRICIECNACEKVCPVIKGPSTKDNNSTEPFTVAGWHNHMEIRMASSSGGAFSSFAECVIEQNGVVYGAGWGDNLNVVHKRIEHIDGLEDLRKSKYVQSQIGDAYKLVKKDLIQGRLVLFAGSPCQIAGLYTFLHNKNYDNLYTVDFICHGVPSDKVFKAYLNWVENKYNESINTINFRDKSLGVESGLIIKAGFKRSNKVVKLIGNMIPYYRGFIGNLFLRESCYNCKFNIMPRVADISMCDYRGLGDRFLFANERERIYGFTGIMVNNSHGRDLLDMSNLNYEVRPFEELSCSQEHLRTPSKRTKNTDLFYADLEKYGFAYTVDKYMQMTKHHKIDLLLRRTLGAGKYYALGRFIKKWIFKTRTV